MKITIEAEWATYTTEFKNSDVSMLQIAEALEGMLVSYGWQIETVNEYIKTEEI